MHSLRGTVPRAVVGQALLIELAAVAAASLHASWWGVVAIVSLGGVILAGSLLDQRWAAAWICSLAAWLSLFSTVPASGSLGIPALIAGALWLTRSRWNKIALAWTIDGALALLVHGYLSDAVLEFYFGLAAFAATLVLLRVYFFVPPLLLQAINTLLLLLVAIPAIGLIVRPPLRVNAGPENWRRFYSYDRAKGNPAAFAAWYAFFERQYTLMGRDIYEPTTNALAPHQLRPGSAGFLLQCPISINREGFRGPEIPRRANGAYRIVAFGESTTFGMTIARDDQPWPALLEQMIRQRLRPQRLVEVINAGIPAYSLSQNLPRLLPQILPLQPDLLISYHGYNDFPMLDPSLPARSGPEPPEYLARPLRAAADCEYRFKMWRFRRSNAATPPSHPRRLQDPLKTGYGVSYEALARWAQTNRVRLAVANYSMAVNSNSDERVLAFYRGAFPSVDWEWRANAAHSILVREVQRRHPEICLIDTHPALDGQHEKFIDHVHLTQEGRRQLAENIFAGLRPFLEKELQCAPAAETMAP